VQWRVLKTEPAPTATKRCRACRTVLVHVRDGDLHPLVPGAILGRYGFSRALPAVRLRSAQETSGWRGPTHWCWALLHLYRNSSER
jgi:hypothetical protein